MTISFAITACTEHVELENLLDKLNSVIDENDEIIVQLDTKCTAEVKNVSEKYNTGTPYEYHRIHCDLNNDFAAFKNNLMEFCTRDYIFFIDADESFHDDFVRALKAILRANPEIDCINVPRRNTVEGITVEHIQKWGWIVNSNGLINFPDYQTRICKNRRGIKWQGKVHEKLVNWKSIANLPIEDNWSPLHLIHKKTIEKQEIQNTLYSRL